MQCTCTVDITCRGGFSEFLPTIILGQTPNIPILSNSALSLLCAIENMASTQSLDVVNIGTRRSQLAIAQVDMIKEQLEAAVPGTEFRTQIVSTMADENQVKSFQDFNAKSIWTEELEQLLADNKLDVIVHCLKGTVYFTRRNSVFVTI
jgi:hypothetical protein